MQKGSGMHIFEQKVPYAKPINRYIRVGAILIDNEVEETDKGKNRGDLRGSSNPGTNWFNVRTGNQGI